MRRHVMQGPLAARRGPLGAGPDAGSGAGDAAAERPRLGGPVHAELCLQVGLLGLVAGTDHEGASFGLTLDLHIALNWYMLEGPMQGIDAQKSLTARRMHACRSSQSG